MMPAIYKISPNEITTRRVDPWHYQPKFAKQIAKIGVHLGESSLFELINKERDVAGGATPLGASYLEKGRVRFYRTSEVDELQLDRDAAVFISDEDDQKLARSRLAAGDVLLTITGAKFGKSAVVTEMHLPGNISQHSVRFSPDANKLDPYFLVAYLNGPTGQIAIWREAYGATRPAIDFPSIRSLTVPSVGNLVQKYIGDKVRQAERLRAWALELEQYAKNSFQEDFQWDGTVLSVKPFNRLRVDELENRLDLKYNSPQRLAAIRHAKKVNAKLQQLDELVDISAMIGWKGLTTENYTTTGPWLLRGVEFSSGVIRTEDLVCVEEHKYLEQPQIHLKEGDIALTKDGTIGKAIVIPRLPNRIAAGSTVARLRKKATSDVDPYYLEFAIAHEFVQCQIASFATGVAQPHITQEWIALLNIPRVKSENEIASAWQQHHISLNFAKHLTNAAKVLIEALIEGQLTEVELIAAEQALQAGNDQLDRRVLNRLKTDGVDGQGPALFGDLDELYHLLTQAQED